MRRQHLLIGLITVLVLSGLGWPRAAVTTASVNATLYLPVIRKSSLVDYALVFVSRQIPDAGSIYWDVPNALPGVGAHSRFRVAAPGKLMVREPDGTLRVLVDGANPQPPFNLIDVNAPDVSYDGGQIVFAGLPTGSYNPNPVNNPSAWRIYKINVDGTGLTQITFSDQNLDLSQFGPAAGGLGAYDDTDPVWLPDGRLAFSSTRWPSYGQYSGVRVTNLYVVNANGANLHRITSERNGADRPLVDPLTGKIVYARWWRNHRFALNSMATIANPNGGYDQKDGLSALRNVEMDGSNPYRDYLWRNAWQAATINPDGTGLAMWGGEFRDEAGNHVYGGAFTPQGDLIANFFPMYNMTEAAGFGGLRRYSRGPGSYTPIIGITTLSNDYVHCPNPNDCSYGIYNGAYAAEPEVLPDGRLIVSYATDVYQDYGLYIINPDGTGLTPVYNNPGASELRARAIRVRHVPPVLADTVIQSTQPLPPSSTATTYTQDGTFLFDALNVYFNAPVDWDIVSAPPVGSAATIRFFLDQQRTSPGSFPNLDWPILLGEKTISPSGAVSETAPAYLPLFEQLRSAVASGYTVPLTFGPRGEDGAAHVTGMNYGPNGAVARCVGCHAGHTLIPVPATAAAAEWTNLAPGASVVVSSSRNPNYDNGVIDRRVLKGEIWRYWNSSDSQSQDGQWVRLTFLTPIAVRQVMLYNPRFGDEANSSLQVVSAGVELCSDLNCNTVVATQTVSSLAVAGTPVNFADVSGVRAVRVTLTDVSGTFYGLDIASLAEIEVIGKGE